MAGVFRPPQLQRTPVGNGPLGCQGIQWLNIPGLAYRRPNGRLPLQLARDLPR